MCSLFNTIQPRKKYSLIILLVAAVWFVYLFTQRKYVAHIPHTRPAPKKKILTDDLDIKSIFASQTDRRETLQAVCKKRRQLSKLTLHSIFVDDRHQVLYCAIPKTGTSTLTGLLKQVKSTTNADVSPRLLRQGLPTLLAYSQKQIRCRLSKYYKFIFVRHPLTRLVSAFRDKFRDMDAIGYRMAPQLFEYESQITSETGHKGDKIRFIHFLNYLRNYTIEGEKRPNKHWDIYQNVCNPCSITYDFIGKHETFALDVEYLMRHVFKFNITTMRTRNWTGSNETVARQFFRSVPVRLRREVIEFYEKDAEMFGYNVNQFY